MRRYLQLFEDVLRAEARELGTEVAYYHARKAGLEVSLDGRVLGCSEDPQLVLLRLIRHFAASGRMPALVACTPLISEILRRFDIDEDSVKPKRIGRNATGKIRTGGSSSGGA